MTWTLITRPMPGECDGLLNTRPETADHIIPLFDIPRPTSDPADRKYMSESRYPTLAYLDRIAQRIWETWSFRPAMVDASFWAPGSQAENGDCVATYVIRQLKSFGMPVIPLVGYDQWASDIYKAALVGMGAARERSYCLRLDRSAIEDAEDPEFFRKNVEEILSTLDLFQSKGSVLIDLGDVSGTALDEMLTSTSRVIDQLTDFGFVDFTTAGCSIPRTIDLAVKHRDSEGMVIRREALLWKALRKERRGVTCRYGDYGVRGPYTNDGRQSNNTNGKIRHTVQQQSFVLRGHALRKGESAAQMQGLAAKLVASDNYLGPSFSWGDARIWSCSRGRFFASVTGWIAIDTNHHIAWTTQEVDEFERSVVVALNP